MSYISWSIVSKAFLVGAALYILSLFLYFYSSFSVFAFVVLNLFFLFACVKDIKYGLGLALVELITSSHGRLIVLPSLQSPYSLSLRISWFLILLICFAVHLLKNRNFELRKIFPIYLIAFYLIILWGFLDGAFFSKINFSKVFLDGNGYIYLLIAPVFLYVARTRKSENFFISSVFGSLIVLSVATIFIFFIFSNVYLNDYWLVYRWARSTILAEITWAGGGYFRVFLPSQLWLIPGIFLSWFFYKETGKQGYILLSSVFLVSLFLSLSRSFGVGLLFSVLFSFLLFWRNKVSIPRSLLEFFLILVIGAYILGGFINIPGNIGGIGGEILNSRISGFEEPGIKSRLSQIKPLLSGIKENPIFGSGFGKEIMYRSFDPRVLNRLPRVGVADGLYKTYAFELGYLDMALKLGAVGVAVILVFLFWLTKNLISIKRYGWVWAVGLVGIAATHAFSPYLNHPLGLGYVAFVLSLINAESNDTNSNS